MKHFVIEITYHVPAEQLGETVGEHRAFLDGGYQSGLLLMSGPQKPKIGGMVIARAESVDDLRAFFAGDPFQRKGLAGYRFIEFETVKQQGFMQDWISGK
jgi:uncharacterized protein YciI